MALAATAIVERERRTSNRGFVEFLVGDRVHVLEPVQFAGNVGKVVKRNVGSVVVRLEGSNVSLEALHSQLRGFGECRAGDRVRTSVPVPRGRRFYAGLVHVFCWYAQIHPGHGIYEGRKAGLRSTCSGPGRHLYLHGTQVAFACGYPTRPSSRSLDAAVEKATRRVGQAASCQCRDAPAGARAEETAGAPVALGVVPPSQPSPRARARDVGHPRREAPGVRPHGRVFWGKDTRRRDV